MVRWYRRSSYSHDRSWEEMEESEGYVGLTTVRGSPQVLQALQGVEFVQQARLGERTKPELLEGKSVRRFLARRVRQVERQRQTPP